MNKGYNTFDSHKKTLFRRPPQVQSSKSEIHAKYHKILEINFEDHQLTSFSGPLIFQVLFSIIKLKQRLKDCFRHLTVTPIFGHHIVTLLLIVHVLLGFRRLREVDYYRDDPFLLRLQGLRKMPDVAIISRTLSRAWSSAMLKTMPVLQCFPAGDSPANQFYTLCAMICCISWTSSHGSPEVSGR